MPPAQPQTPWLRHRRLAVRSERVRAAVARLDVALGETGLVAAALFLTLRLLPAPDRAVRMAWITGGAWLVAAISTKGLSGGPLKRRWAGAAVRWLLFAGAWTIWLRAAPGAAHAGAAVAALYLAAALAAYHGAVFRAEAREGPRGRWEAARLLTLLLGGVILMHPFAARWVHGSGDAGWYANMTADAVAQTRAGFVPILSGQSEFQFNGAVFPVRIAPAFLHLGALLDAFTFRTLAPAPLQNLLIIALGSAALLSAYLCLGALLPGRRGAAWALALLYFTCPGVIGLVYNTDLFMTWTTLPWVPVVVYGLARALDDEDDRGWFWVATGMGGMWWGHSPEALFLSLAVAGAAACWVLRRPGWASAARAARWIGLGAVLAGYPILSYLAAAHAAGNSAGAFSATNPDTVLWFVREAFPGTLRPLSDLGRQLPDLQLGYALTALLVLAAAAALSRRGLALRLLAAAAVGYYLLLVPVPGLNAFLWRHLPAIVLNASAGWAMNRLYVPVAALVAFAAALALRDRPARRGSRLAGVAALAWAVLQVSRFWHGSAVAAHNPVVDPQRIRPENATATRNAYLVFPKEPSYYSHGAVDPLLENRLFRRADLAPLARNLPAALAAARNALDAAEGPFVIGPDRNRLQLDFPVVLEPGRRYVLDFEFLRPEVQGVLVLEGGSFQRTYGMPTYGEAGSFGAAAGHPHALGLWTTSAEPQRLTVAFYSPAYLNRPEGMMPFGRARLAAYDPAALPVRVRSWLPYRADVAAPEDAWLETPRMYQSGYAADVGGRPAEVRRSPEGLAMVAVPGGRSEVTLRLRVPAWLTAAFWAALAAWLALLARALGASCSRGR